MKNKTLAVNIVSFISLFIFFFLLLRYFAYPHLLDAGGFLNWDAAHYMFIREYGYEGFRVAFFPLAPMLWKIFNLNVPGVIIFNSVLFLFSFYVLAKELRINSKEIFLYLAVPSSFFYFLPYSESVFFTCSVLVIIGLKRDNLFLLLIALFLASLARPAFTVFLPALAITEFFLGRKNAQSFFRMSAYILVSAAGFLLVGIIQHYYTAEWFGFFAAQKDWGNELQLPAFPLTSWGGGLIVRLDGTALLIGFISGLAVLYMLRKKYSKNPVPPEVIFSLCYLAGISLSVLFFRGGSLFSLNRFVFATPFIIVAFHFYLQREFSLSAKQLLLIFFLLQCWWLAFGSYVHIQAFLKFAALSLCILLIFALKLKKAERFSFYMLTLTGLFFQLYFLTHFLNGGWVA